VPLNVVAKNTKLKKKKKEHSIFNTNTNAIANCRKCSTFHYNFLFLVAAYKIIFVCAVYSLVPCDLGEVMTKKCEVYCTSKYSAEILVL